MTFDADDFAAWRDNPITQAVFKALKTKEAEAKAVWWRSSWNDGKPDAQLLADLRATAETYAWTYTLTYEELEAELEESDSDEAGSHE